jgi:hypothetical protein
LYLYRDAHISNQKGDMAGVFLFPPSLGRQMAGFCVEEVYGTVISFEAFRTHQ